MSFKDRWIFRLYNVLFFLLSPLILLGIVLRWHRRIFSRGGEHWEERWGHLPKEWSFSKGDRWWWVHAVSLGEVKAIEPFLREAPASAGVRVLLSAVTPEALEWANEKKVAERIVAAPIDIPWTARRVFQRVRPELFVSVESEFWPNLLREAQRSGARIALINGRISERSYRRYGWIRGIVKALWPLVDLFSLREQQDADRFAGLGVDPGRIRITGHLKYDLVPSRSTPPRNSPEAPILVLGSTREGEEKLLLTAIEPLCIKYPGLRVIWAPRHVARISEVESLLTARGLASQRKSALAQNGNGLKITATHVMWDTLGDLVDAYQMADVSVVGGSFVEKGGQNPIEPAAQQRPVLFGPSMTNFKDIARHLVDEGGARQVTTESLEKNLDELLKTPALRQSMGERARNAVLAEQGATQRTLGFLKELVGRG